MTISHRGSQLPPSVQATLSLCSFLDIPVETVPVGTITAGSDAAFGDVGTCYRIGALLKPKGQPQDISA